MRSVGGREERGQINQWFIVDDGVGEGGCTAKFVANFLVALDDETTFLALDCVLFGERGTAAVTSGGEARGFLCQWMQHMISS